jgi:hypothetical protein
VIDMAENLIRGATSDNHAHRPWGWYPNVYNYNDSSFVYLNSLKDAKYSDKVYTKANDLMTKAFSELSDIDIDLSNLKALINLER